MTRRTLALLCFVALVATFVPLLGSKSPEAAPLAFGRVHAEYQPNRGKIFVLVIGSDARHGNPDLRADAIHIAGINTKTMRGGILNFPRDSYVNIPGHGSAKINEALYRGGPRLLARTLEAETGIRLDYWALVGFEGFEDIVSTIGPIPMRLHRPVYDQGGSGARLRAGKHRLRAWQALAYVRTRKAFSGGDFTRTGNQARFLLAMLRKLRDDVDRNPATLLRWMAATRRYARLNLSGQELYRLGVLASQVSPKRVRSVTVPGSTGSVGAASVVFIGSGADSIYKRFRKNASL
jgi:polyisoprenyl-teichoic acid--peptidoglycan teichoic acid transferase